MRYSPQPLPLRQPNTALLKVPNAAQHAQPIARAAYPFMVPTKASDMPLGSMKCRKESHSEKIGCGNESDARKLWRVGVLR